MQNRIVLVLEDDDILREVLCKIFEASSYECSPLTTENAIQYIKDHRNDSLLILVDLMMPGMSGWEFLKLMKSFKPSIRMKLVVMTGLPSSQWANAQQDADLILRKPFSIEELLKIAQTFFSDLEKNNFHSAA